MVGRIVKALILGWIGKKVYDHTLGSDAHEVPEKKSKPVAPAKRTSPTRARRTARKAA